MNSGSGIPAKPACLTQICWKWGDRELKCAIVPVMAPVAAPRMAFLGISYERVDTLPTPSMGPGQPGRPGPSAVETAAVASGTGSVCATTPSPSMGACLAWAHPLSTRNATYCPAQWMACGPAGPPGPPALQHVVVATTCGPAPALTQRQRTEVTSAWGCTLRRPSAAHSLVQRAGLSGQAGPPAMILECKSGLANASSCFL